MMDITASENKFEPPSGIDSIKSALEKKPDAVLDFVARDAGVSLKDVILCLPDTEALSLSGTLFDQIMQGLSSLGTITFIVHTEDIVLECKGEVPEGSYGRGYYNIHGLSPIGGHIKAENCASIHFVSREMMGRLSHALIFCNKQGHAMFKIYLGRDENRELIPSQVEKFQGLRHQFSTLVTS